MELTCEKPKNIEDGAHEGMIIGIEYRKKPYKYMDVVIEFDGNTKLKAGYPQNLLVESRLGKLLERFGVDVQEGMQYDPEKILIGRRCVFTTVRIGKFANIISESVKAKVESVKAKVETEAVK